MANGSQFILVSIPMEVEKIKLLMQTAEKGNFKFIDLTPAFENENDFVIPDDGHWNLKGHRLAAEELDEVFQDKR